MSILCMFRSGLRVFLGEPSGVSAPQPGVRFWSQNPRLDSVCALLAPQSMMRPASQPGATEARQELEAAREAADSIDHQLPPEFLGIGIRIEDDVLITEDGHRNLTEAVPVLPDAVEALCAEASALPRL